MGSVEVAASELVAAKAIATEAKNACFNTRIFIETPHILEW
jgi:hypothetical protein